MTHATARELLEQIVGVGRDARRGGYSRHVFEPAETELRAWFAARARELGLTVETDRNANIWAWWGAPGPGALVTGSHLDSVPGGGAHDGPLGVVSALDAVGRLRESGFTPSRPLAIVVFAEEEGSRFGVACLGSRLPSGAISPGRAGRLTDAAGRTFAEVAAAAGYPDIGRDDVARERIGLFLELHVEQGRALADLGSPIAVGASILEHGRWRIEVHGHGNHAGTTAIPDRRDPMLPSALAVLAARDAAAARSGARATIGRFEPVPGGTNVIASRVTSWLDVRADTPQDTRGIVDDVRRAVEDAAADEGCQVAVSEESYSAEVRFDAALRDRLLAVLADAGFGSVPVLPTGAGHDAGVLAAVVPTAMLFVRNPSGVSHAPEERADDDAIDAGVDALVAAIRGLAGDAGGRLAG